MTKSRLIPRILGFTVLPMVSALAPFLLLPVLAHTVSIPEWVGLGVGQSVGMLTAVVVLLGWQIFGPTAVAGSRGAARHEWYLQSLASRLLCLLVLAPIGGTAAFFLTPDGGRLLAVSMVLAIAISGLNPVWYFVAGGNVGAIALWDMMPRVAATLLCVPLVLSGLAPVVYPVALALASVFALALLSCRILAGVPVWSYLCSPTFRSRLRLAWAPMATDVASNAFSSGSTALFSMRASAQEVAVFSSVYRLYRLGSYLAAAAVQALQGWVVEPKLEHERARRRRNAVQIMCGVAVLGGAGAALTFPGLSRLLFTESYAIDAPGAIFAGVALACWTVSTSLGRHVLAPLGRTRLYLVATVGAAVVGVPAMVVAPLVGDETLGCAVLALGQAVSLSVLLPSALPPLLADRFES